MKEQLVTAGFTPHMGFFQLWMLYWSKTDDKSSPLSVVLPFTERNGANDEGRGRTNRLYNISENTAHCPLCVLPGSNKDCHYQFIYVCVIVERMQLRSCPCTGLLLQAQKKFCIWCELCECPCLCLMWKPTDPNMPAHPDRLHASQ